MGKILIFDIWGDYGHFKKYYTTTSPLTFSFPPRPTIVGIVSAIIGLDKTEYLKYFSPDEAHIALKILKPVKKVRMGLNLIDTKKARLFSRIKQRTQIRTEYLKDPAYRIYIGHKDEEILARLKNYLIRHESVYTVSLGLSELLADFAFAGVFEVEAVSPDNFAEIDSVISSENIEINFEEGKEYFSSVMPVVMKVGRVVTRYADIKYERNGARIQCKPTMYHRVENGENIIFI